MASDLAPCRFAFIFPLASGHVNPSLPLARALVRLGHDVHYLCGEPLREAIESTGANFHSDVAAAPELYAGREADVFGAAGSMKWELGLENENWVMFRWKLRMVMSELLMPGTIRWLEAIRPKALVFCPLVKFEAAYAAQVLGIPAVGLMPMAGPGSLVFALQELMEASHTTAAESCQALEAFEPHRAAVRRLNERYNLKIPLLAGLRPFGKWDTFGRSVCTLVTTCEDLQDPLPPELAELYAQDGTVFEAVGPLLDEPGAPRGAASCTLEGEDPHGSAAAFAAAASAGGLAARVRRARAAGRRTVLVSMGTVVTGDSPMVGWAGRLLDAGGRPRGLTGRELCQAAWGGVFDALGEETAEDSALLVLAVGPQLDALGDLAAPANAVCLPTVPQVDLLRAGVDVFLTHGGQNSFTEALSSATPMVVCPGFGDQAVNARKAEALGVGVALPRPEPAAGDEAAAARRYRAAVAAALRRVLSDGSFAEEAKRCSIRLAASGGVQRALEVVLGAAKLAAPAAEPGPDAPPAAEPGPEPGPAPPLRVVLHSKVAATPEGVALAVAAGRPAAAAAAAPAGGA